MAKKAIVTLAIGSAYAERFERCCRAGWNAYADRHGYELFVVTEPLDASERARRRSPAWQKCLVLSLPHVADCEQVVWIDSDVCINPSAPSVVESVPPECIGATDEHAFPAPGLRQRLLDAIIASSPEDADFGARYWRQWRDPGVWHSAVGLPAGQAHIVQTGVLVLSPKHHRETLEHVYYRHNDDVPNYEMRPLSYEIQARGFQYWIDPRFNALLWWMFLERSLAGSQIVSETELAGFVRESFAGSYFLHFAGCAHLMPLMGR